MKSFLEAVRQVFILPIALIMGFMPVSIALAAPVLNLAIATNTGPIAPGQNATYVLTVSNTGDMSTGTINLDALVPNHTTVPLIQTDEGAGCSSSVNAVTCLPGEFLRWQISLDPGASLTRQFSALVDSTLPPPDGTVITSTASTSLGLSVDASVIVRSAAGLNMTLDSTPNSVSPGGVYRYKLTYSNAGLSLVNADLTFSLPAGASITSASDGGAIIGGTVTWNLGDLSGGASGTLYVDAQVPASTVDGALVLAGALLSDNAGTQEPAAANVVTSVGNVTPLEIAVSTLPDPVQPGQNVTYVVNVSNPDSSATGTINLYARVPNHTTVPLIQTDEGAGCSSSVNAATCLPGELLRWQISLDPGASLTRQFSALVDSLSPPANGTLLSTVVNTGYDGGAGVTGEAVVGDPGLMLALDAPPGSIVSGGSYTYTLTYGNGGASAINAELKLRLPLGTIFQSASGGGTFAGGVVSWNVGVLVPGQASRQQVTLQAPSPTTVSLVLAEAQLRDPITLQSHARASAVTSVGNVTPLEIAVSTLPDPVQPGQNVTYVVNVSNPDSSATGTINLYARVPNHTTVPLIQTDEGAGCSSSVNAATCLPGELLRWQISLDPGASLTRQFSALVDSLSPPANGTLLSTVVNTGYDGGAGVTGEAVVGDPGLMLALDAPPGSIVSGGSYTYTLTYGNGGASAINAELKLRLPLGTIFQSASGGGTFAGGVVSWNVGVLVPGQASRQQVTLQAPSPTTVSLVLAEAQLRDPITLQSHARASAVTSVGNVTPLEIAVSTLPDPVQPGQNVTYVVNVSNPDSSATGTINLYARVPNHTTVPLIQTDEGAGCSSSVNAATCLPGELLRWQISLDPGASLTRQFSALVDSLSPPANGTLLSTVVNTGYDGGAGVTGEAVVGDPGLMLALDAPPGSIVSGGSYTYTLTYGNGGASAINAELKLRLPLGTIFQSASGGGTFAGGVVSWNVGVLVPGQASRQQVTLQAPSPTTVSLVLAEAQLRDPITLQSHARASAVTSVGNVTPLEIAVSTLPDPVQPGQNVTYVVNVSNPDSSATGTINLYARVPNHTTVPLIQTDEGAGCSSSVNAATCLPGELLRWQISLDPGASLTRQFSALVDSLSPPANGTLLSTVVNTGYDGGTGVTGEAVVGSDTDGDGVNDASDNCTLIPNPDQRDTDADGFGNVCDGDFDNNLAVNFADLGYMKSVFFTTDADADLNGDGAVNFADLGLLKSMFFQPPGPSGLVP